MPQDSRSPAARYQLTVAAREVGPWPFLNFRVRYRADKLLRASLYSGMDDRKAQELRDQAKKYRAIARASTDGEEAGRLFELAAKLEKQARHGKPDDD